MWYWVWFWLVILAFATFALWFSRGRRTDADDAHLAMLANNDAERRKYDWQ